MGSVSSGPTTGAGGSALTAESLVAALFTQSPLSIALYDAEGRVAAANAAYERHFGIRLADVPADWSLRRDPQLAAAGLLPLLERAYAGEAVTLPAVRYDAAQATGGSGRSVWTQGHCYPVRDAAGAVTHVAVVHVDVTDWAAAEAARAEAVTQLEGELAQQSVVLGQLAEGVIVADASGRLTFVNAAAERLHGVARLDVPTEQYAETYHLFTEDGQPYPSIELPLARAVRHGETVNDARWLIRRPDGTEIVARGSARPLIAADGSQVGAVLTVRDDTARVAMEHAEAERERLLAESEVARSAAEAASAAKGQFVASMSHELRTPLNAIAGYVQLIEMGVHGPISEEQRTALARVQSAQRRLLALINDVLNFSKLESGRVEYDIRAVDVRDVIGEVVPLIEPQMRARGLVLDAEFPEGEDAPNACAVAADREKLGQVLVNLFSNAIKFTPSRNPVTGAAGRVTVSVEAPPTCGVPATGMVLVRVEDNGIGIPTERLESIFEPFVQVHARDASYAHATEGTGLGLAISRDLARGMGGELTVRSEPGHGSTFTVWLPPHVVPGAT